MPFKEQVEHAFGADGNSLIMRWLIDTELADCHDGSSRWRRFFEKCDDWDKELLVWRTEEISIDGVNGWYMDFSAGRFRLPEEFTDWTAYLYRTALLMQLSYDEFATEAGRQKIITEADPADLEDYHGLLEDYYLESDSTGRYTDSPYTAMTREEWLDELRGAFRASRKKWESWLSLGNRKSDPEYAVLIREMEEAYPAFWSVLERLELEAGTCDVVRMNRQGRDVTVWYFVKCQDSFFVVRLSDCM